MSTDEVKEPEAVSEASVPEAPDAARFTEDLKNLLSKRPGLAARGEGEPFPQEVLTAYMAGEDLTVAYLDYEAKKAAAERAALVEHNRILRQNQSAAAKAPVKGVSGSGDLSAREDQYLAGFDDNDW